MTDLGYLHLYDVKCPDVTSLSEIEELIKKELVKLENNLPFNWKVEDSSFSYKNTGFSDSQILSKYIEKFFKDSLLCGLNDSQFVEITKLLPNCFNDLQMHEVGAVNNPDQVYLG